MYDLFNSSKNLTFKLLLLIKLWKQKVDRMKFLEKSYLKLLWFNPYWCYKPKNVYTSYENVYSITTAKISLKCLYVEGSNLYNLREVGQLDFFTFAADKPPGFRNVRKPGATHQKL